MSNYDKQTHNANHMLHNDVIKWKPFPRYWPLRRESIGHQWIPFTKASDAELWLFFDLCLNKRLSKQSRRRWFEAQSRSFWRHCNVYFGIYSYCIQYDGNRHEVSCFYICLAGHIINRSHQTSYSKHGGPVWYHKVSTCKVEKDEEVQPTWK